MNIEQGSQIEEVGLKPLELARMQALARLDMALQSPDETTLREHQMSMVQSLADHLRKGETAGYMSEPTGSGKSVVIVKLAEMLGLKTVILSPTQQILLQTYDAAKKFTPNLNIANYYAREKDSSGDVLNTTYQSLSTLTESGALNPENIRLVICDETHTALGEQRHAIFRNFPNALKIGLTATPYFDQLEGHKRRGIVEQEEEWTGLFTNLIHEMTLEEAMEREILTPLDVYLLKTNTIVSDIQILSNREYRESDIRKYFATKARNALAIGMLVGTDNISKEYQLSEEQKEAIEDIHNKIAGKRTSIFAIDIEHAEELAQELRNQGISASAVHGKVDVSTRRKILESHQKGEIQVVIGVDMLSIGWDSPTTEVGIYLRPTYSGVVVVQQLGRILRQSPETGKQEAIAIQLVDQFRRRVDSPVLIPGIFDPEYILRGTQTGEGPSLSRTNETREKPIVTFSGMDIETIIEESRSKDIIRSRFSRGSVEEIASLADSLMQEAQEKYPDIQLYELFKIITDELPERIPSQAQEKSMQAVASIDTNTRKLGKKSLLFLNMKTILTVVGSYFLEEIDTKEDRDEMLSAAAVSVLEKLSNLSPNHPVYQQVYYAARDGVADYLAKRDNIPVAWVKEAGKRQLISEKINEVLVEGADKLTDEKIDNLSEDLSRETGVSQDGLLDYFVYLRLLNKRHKGTVILDVPS